MIQTAALRGDGPALSLLKEEGRLLGVGITSLVNLFAPEVAILGGGVAGAGEVLFQAIRDEVRRRAMRPASEQVRIVGATLGNEAGTVGAARLMFTA